MLSFLEAYGSSLPPLTLVTVTFPLFRSVDLMVCDVGLPLSVCQVLVMIFLPSDVTLVLCSSFMFTPPVDWLVGVPESRCRSRRSPFHCSPGACPASFRPPPPCP